MKINNLTTGFDGVGMVQPDVHTPAGPGAAGRKDPASDRVELSSGAQLARSAMGAVGQAAEIRADKVETAKALLEAGRLGSDPMRLAEAMIARILEND